MSDRKLGKSAGNRGKGRKPGSKNKIPANLKEQILEAAKQAGGESGIVGYLKAQAVTNPGPFMALLGKVLPTQVTGADGGPIKTQEVSARDKLADRVLGIVTRSREEELSGKPH